MDVLWFLGLVLAIVLLIIYWRIYIDVSTFTSVFEPLLPKFSFVIITLFIVKIFLKISLPILNRAVKPHFKSGEWKVVRMLYIYFVWFLALIIIISGVLGNFSSLGISLSLLGAGLAFALQQVILSFAAWFLIMVKRPYKIGDRIYIKSNDILGDVENITMLFTVLKDVTGDETVTGKNVIIPNSVVFLEPIINYSYDIPQVWLSIPVSVTYESDLGLAERIIFNAAKEVAGEEMKQAARLMRTKTPESVQVEFALEEPVLRVGFADSSTTVTVRVMCLPKLVPAIRTEVYRKVLEEFNNPENKDKVEIAYPHMELVLHDEGMGDYLKNFLKSPGS
ncbi:MAG: mechanosensitive ion channel [ANME-2 cluster archaeon]|nr:mechanosensitive ion channel [ANME-2 cluster archaeon]